MKSWLLSPWFSRKYNYTNFDKSHLPPLRKISEFLKKIAESTSTKLHSGVGNGTETQIPGTLGTWPNIAGTDRDKNLWDSQIPSFGTSWDQGSAQKNFGRNPEPTGTHIFEIRVDNIKIKKQCLFGRRHHGS